MRKFSIIISGFDLDEPLPRFSERESALGFARGLIARLPDTAPAETTVEVMCGRTAEAIYSIESWRMAVRFVGDKAYE